jgi:hypothetical protein
MAGGKLSVEIGADITDFEKKIKEVEFDIKELSKIKLDRLKVGLDTTEINSQIKDAKASLNSLKTAVNDTGQSFASATPKVANAGNTLTQFSRIAQDAPFGIIGIGNNITATAESFTYLKQQTGSTGGALKALASSIAGTGGILLGVSLLTTGLTLLAQSGLTIGDVIDKITGNFDEFGAALKKTNDEAYASKAVQEAVTNVNSLTNEINLAKQGFLNKDQVVEHYNETIGKTTGLVNNIEEAEKALIKNGDAYIKMTLYKAAATLALEEAAKKQLEAERVRIKKLEEFDKISDNFITTSAGGFNPNAYAEASKAALKAQKKRKEDEIKVNEDAAKINLSIAKKFQEDAAKISKDFNFNFFGDTQAPKAVKTFNTPQVTGVTNAIIPAPLFDVNGIAVFNGQVDAFGNKIKELPGVIKSSLVQVPVLVNEALIQYTVIMAEFTNQLNELIQNSVPNAIANLGSALGEALATGTDVVSALGTSLLQSLGSFISELGKMLIQYGLLLVGFGKAQLAFQAGDPVTKIGAGIAMIALGIAASAAGSAIGSFAAGNGKGGGRASNSSGAGANNSSFTSSGFSSRGDGGGTVVFEIAGQKLIGVLSNTINANRRLGGTLGLG